MRLAPLLVVAVLLAGCTTVPVTPARPTRLDAWPAWEVGDSWTWHVRSRGSDAEWREGEVRGTVLAVEGDTYLVRTVDNEGTTADQRFWRGNLSLTTSRSETFRLPLHAGANWTSGRLDFRVVGHERVATPAGGFWAWHINGTDAAPRPTAWRDDWWAPEAKVWVKSRQVQLVQNGYVGIERELQAYELVQDREASS